MIKNKKASFDEIFKNNTEGNLVPIKSIKINGLIYKSDTFGPIKNHFGGVDFSRLKEKDLAIEEEKELIIIKGIYNG